MKLTTGLPVERFLQTLEIVAREGKHLSYSWSSLFRKTIDAEWVRSLEQAHDCAERLEAFVSRFGRMQARWRINATLAARPRRGSGESN